MQKHSLIFLLLTLAAVNGVQKYLKFYSKKDQQGNSVILEENVSDLEGLGSIINSNGSYEAIGSWDCFADKNFVNFKGTRFLAAAADIVQKGNLNLGQPGLSCRHWGGSDSGTEALTLTLYSKEDNAYCLGGSELRITGPAYSFVPFVPTGLVVTAWSNWTIFEDPNFTGKSICLVSKSETSASCVNETLAANMKSIYKNCLGRIDSYVYL